MGQLSVLLVDDNPIFLRILTRFLSEHGEGLVQIAGSVVGGRDAVVEARRIRPDVVLLDLAMPDLPGLELLPRLREALPGTIIVVLTLMDLPDCRRAALAAGADDVVSKVSLDRDLVPAIRRLVSGGPRAAHASSEPAAGPEGTRDAPVE